MANKTQENDWDVAAFLESVENPKRRADAEVVLAMMARITGLPKCGARRLSALGAITINMKVTARGILCGLGFRRVKPTWWCISCRNTPTIAKF
ncbi:MAG: hypothetical protein COB08_012255 [Rhodobacteraceae bacterium]|nr:hypothetical protein [Paracoccaceae bacterium]